MKPISALPRIPMLKKVPITPVSSKTQVSSKPPAKQSTSTTSSSSKPLPLKPRPRPPPPPTSSAMSKLPKIPKKIQPSSSASEPKKAAVSNSVSKKPASGVSPSHSSFTSAPSSSSSSVPSAPPKPASSSSLPMPNNQIRQNIRRSLKEILFKRVNDSDDLAMSEKEVAHVAISIEKEMFNLYKDTGSGYKSKYRTIMFNMKDPKNQGLFQRVLRGEIGPVKLVRLKPEVLASKRLSSWKETESKTEQQETARVPPAEKSTSALPDIFSSMLEDTTSQHRAHLFDLKCKICTGQISADDEPPPKRQKTTTTTTTTTPAMKKPEPKIKPEDDEPPPPPEDDSDTPMETNEIKDSIPNVVPEPVSLPNSSPPPPQSPVASQAPILPVTNPVTTVTGSGRDPRRAINRPPVPAASATPPDSSPRISRDNEEASAPALPPPPPPPVVSAPKSILMKPTTSDIRYLTASSPNVNMPDMRSPQDGNTPLFLSRLSPIWKGFINMQSVAKFVTKAFPVSGSIEYLNEDLPDTIHIGGRISPKTVWDYVGKLKSSLSKELSLIRFHPATEEEEVAYISLYSYFSSRGRFGVVANNNRHIKDLYLIPLSAKDPIPSKLLPFEGPGKELVL
ncbi:hypothetical protein AB205_0200930 [Aquarana catesbeiana]|uniref:TFIIS central domain-containing protein n=1 Tax=Aquarana catesbeiana TaxID=8400 RepID=A0A2G9RY37_AQUCT|nr:hypothetical protein AB205_0200930 [Aquarana catesbeiana]